MKKILFILLASCGFMASAEPFKIDFVYRKSFVRLEESPILKLEVSALRKATAGLSVEYDRQKLTLDNISLNPGKNLLEIRLETRLKPGSYPLKAVLTSDGAGATAETTIEIATETGDILPVMMWGGGNLEQLKKAGFTHYLLMVNIMAARGQQREAVKAVDKALANNLYVFDRFSLATEKAFLEKYQRRKRDGKPYSRINLDANNPEAIEFCKERAAAVGKLMAGHPGFAAALINSEIRDASHPSFTGFEEAAFKKFSGYDIPAEVKDSGGVKYPTITGFPPSRVISDHDPLRTYYSWFWRTGDGWNPLQGTLSRVYHQYIKHPFFTFYDPATRVPPQWGSGGDVDAISHWTYTNPDPLRMGLAADELLAMADGKPGQKVMKMTQLFWYRDRSAPTNMKVENPPAWLQDETNAKYITISPDHLKIAFWSKISRRFDAILYHGSESLLRKTPNNAYRYTNPETKDALEEVTSRVVKPLGPTLKRIPERQADIAILQSFTNTVFSQSNHSFGSAHAFVSDLHMALQWNHFQPAIIYEEHIARGDLAKYKVLFLPGLEVLPQSTYEAILEFQRRGGIVAADEKIVPGILPDLSIKSLRRYIIADSSKRLFQKLGLEIKKELAPYYKSMFEASNQDIVLRLRSYRDADYLFVLNDKREYGDYVGQYRRVMENGVRNTGTVRVACSAKAIYDLVENRRIEFKPITGGCEIPVDLPPGGGQILLMLSEPLTGFELDTVATAKPGDVVPVTVRVSTAGGKLSTALIPIEITLRDPQGETAAGSGFHCVVDGKLETTLTLSLNDQPGPWQLTARNLANNQTITNRIQVR